MRDTCIEFLRSKDNPWTIEDANTIAQKCIGSKFGSCYREFFFINDETTERLALGNDIQYPPAIDGYHDNYS